MFDSWAVLQNVNSIKTKDIHILAKSERFGNLKYNVPANWSFTGTFCY